MNKRFDEVKQLLLDTLNGEFSRDNERKRTRKIIFWYDSKEDYKELIDELKDSDEINSNLLKPKIKFLKKKE